MSFTTRDKDEQERYPYTKLCIIAEFHFALTLKLELMTSVYTSVNSNIWAVCRNNS